MVPKSKENIVTIDIPMFCISIHNFGTCLCKKDFNIIKRRKSTDRQYNNKKEK